MRGSSRPNVRPAKESYAPTVGNFIKETNNKYGKSYLTQKKPRSTIGDLCDFCLKNIYVKRVAMALRRKGWKFACRKCQYEKKLDGKRDKVWFSNAEPPTN